MSAPAWRHPARGAARRRVVDKGARGAYFRALTTTVTEFPFRSAIADPEPARCPMHLDVLSPLRRADQHDLAAGGGVLFGSPHPRRLGRSGDRDRGRVGAPLEVVP